MDDTQENSDIQAINNQLDNVAETSVQGSKGEKSRVLIYLTTFGLILVVIAGVYVYFFSSHSALVSNLSKTVESEQVIDEVQSVENYAQSSSLQVRDPQLSQIAHISNEYGFLIHPPRDWKVDDSGFYAPLVMTTDSEDIVLTIRVYDSGSSTLDEVVDRIKEELYEGFVKYEYSTTIVPDGRGGENWEAVRGKRISPPYDPSLSGITIEEETILGGKKTYILSDTAFFSGLTDNTEYPNYSAKQYLVLDGKGRGYGIIIEGMNEALEQNAQLIRNVIASFKMIDNSFPQEYVDESRTVWQINKFTLDTVSNLLKIDYEFTSPLGTEGFLSIKFDDELIFVADELYGESKVGSSTVIRLPKDYPPGEYEFGTRLDPHFEGKSSMKIGEITFGYMPK